VITTTLQTMLQNIANVTISVYFNIAVSAVVEL